MPRARRARRDATATADNGGVDGWERSSMVIADAGAHAPGGRLVLRSSRSSAQARVAKLEPPARAGVVASEIQSVSADRYERLEHIRSLDPEATGARNPRDVEA